MIINKDKSPIFLLNLDQLVLLFENFFEEFKSVFLIDDAKLQKYEVYYESCNLYKVKLLRDKTLYYFSKEHNTYFDKKIIISEFVNVYELYLSELIFSNEKKTNTLITNKDEFIIFFANLTRKIKSHSNETPIGINHYFKVYIDFNLTSLLKTCITF